jgi:hypothetical protein
MSEFRAAAKSLLEKRRDETQRNYEKIRKPEDLKTFDEYAATLDPFLEVKVRVNLIIRACSTICP